MEPIETILETVQDKTFNIEIYQDEFAPNPRKDFDNLGTMACFHSRYSLGDDHELDARDYNNWKEVLYNIRSDNGPIVWLPLYLMDHGGLAMNTIGFSCEDPWRFDWGQAGIIYVSHRKLRSEFGWKRINKRRMDFAAQILREEVSTYSDYLSGAVYCYTIKDPEGSKIDSCGSFYGYNHSKNGLMESAKNAISAFAQNN